jgi:hypothetical protein
MCEHWITTPRKETYDRLERSLLLHLPQQPDLAVHKLHLNSCGEKRMKLAALIARSWSRNDINAAWNTVARSSLSATEKQLMFNKLWG